MKELKCKNCASTIEANFCPNCGQKANTHRIDYHEFLHEIQHSIFHVDKGILYTTKQLFTRPGHTIIEYLQGKRVNHFKPVAYVLILTTIYALLSTALHQETMLGSMLEGMINGFSDNKGKPSDSFNNVISIFKWMINHFSYTTLLAIPIVSFVSWLLFEKSGYNYFEHLITNSYLTGQKTVFYLAISPIAYFVTSDNGQSIIDLLKLLATIALTFWTYYSLFSHLKPLKRTLIIILCVIIQYFLFMVILSSIAIATALST